MKKIYVFVLCFLPLFANAQMKDLTEEEISNNQDYKSLKTELIPIEAKAAALKAEYEKATPAQKNSEAFVGDINKRYSVIEKEQNVILTAFIKKNPNSYISLLALSQLSGENLKQDEVEALFAKLSNDVKNTNWGKSVATSLNKTKTTAVGSVAPDFTQDDPKGKPFKLSTLRGKYVLIDFWASWCGPCRRENPNVVRAYQKYKNKNFEILGVSLDNDKSAWLGAIEKDNLIWLHVSDLRGWKSASAQLYGVESIPQNYLLDPQGVIIEKNLRGNHLEEVLAKVLK
jgi:thiol-disulfide isomerase/thioredoxin